MDHYTGHTLFRISKVFAARIEEGIPTNFYDRKAMAMVVRTAKAADGGNRTALAVLFQIFVMMEDYADRVRNKDPYFYLDYGPVYWYSKLKWALPEQVWKEVVR